MNPLFFLKAVTSMRKEVLIVFVIIGSLCLLPMFTLIALAGTSVINTTGGTVYNGPLDPQDEYAFGNCTWWVFMLRQKIGETIPNTWGNAATWASRAQLDGYIVDHVPSYGAIMQISDVDNGLGHVAFVEAVDPTTGAWTISEMNVIGYDETDTKTLPAIDALNFNFIHQQIGAPPLVIPAQ